MEVDIFPVTNEQNYVNCLAAVMEHDTDGETVLEGCGNTLKRYHDVNQ